VHETPPDALPPSGSPTPAWLDGRPLLPQP